MTFGGAGAYLVGPNNAGKSTILSALRTADVLLRYAYRRKADVLADDNGVTVIGYPVSLREFPALRDSLRYEFGGAEARIELTWKSGARLVAIWPEEDDGDEADAFFYLTSQVGNAVKTPVVAKAEFPQLGVIPILGPTEHAERLLDPVYVRQNIAGRLSSRHFRNQLRQLSNDGELEDFLQWAKPWLGDLSFDSLGAHMMDGDYVVEAFFMEVGSRIPKEIVWAGDGIQVWLQLLFHVYRVRERESIILDEPEVYLHPDLQRRLVHLLESTSRQVIIATHSAEMVAEADGRLTTLVDRSKRHARRPKGEADFELLSATLGTALNLRLAKALRSKVAVFVEGQDMAVLRRFAKVLGLSAIENELGITIIPLQGYSNWGHVEPFVWLCNELLPDAIRTHVVLDRDYRPDEVRREVMERFENAGIAGHVWERKELESYLLNVDVISRVSGAPAESLSDWLAEISGAFESEVFGRLLDERTRKFVGAGMHAVTVSSEFKAIFDAAWKSGSYRLETAPPKKIISRLNDKLQSNGYKAVSMTALARTHKSSEIPQEVKGLLASIEAGVDGRA